MPMRRLDPDGEHLAFARAEAVATATKALDLVNPQDKRLAQGIRQHLKLYRAGKPCRPLRNGPTD